MSTSTARDLAELLQRTAQLKRIAGENDFKASAYDKAARIMEGLPAPLEDFLPDRLTEISGIGASLAREISAWAETGTLPVLADLEAVIPAGLLRWLNIPGLGPKKIHAIHKAFGITEPGELLEKARDGALASLPGLGAKSAAKIADSIAWQMEHGDRCHLDTARAIGGAHLERMRAVPGVLRIDLAGSLRRSRETVGDIDLLVAAEAGHVDGIMTAFTEDASVREVLARGDTKSSVRTGEGRQVDLRVVAPDAYEPALPYFTGSKEHNVDLRARARERGLALNEYGLFKLDDAGNTDTQAPVETATERGIYSALDLPWIPPERRETAAYWEADPDGILVADGDIRGVVHAHSTWSDGALDIAGMVDAARARGYEYLTITDHSRSAAYAGGLTIKRVKEQWREIDALNQRLADEGVVFRVFKGIESDILADGALDYPDDVLAGFDIVIASVHQQVDMEAERMRERLLTAVANPFCHMLGHPTGRLLLRREGSRVDLNPVIDAAAGAGVAIEINANPWRLDLDWRYGPRARTAGLLTSINPDAHDAEGIDQIPYGVGIARKAGFAPERVLNTLSAEDFGNWLAQKKSG